MFFIQLIHFKSRIYSLNVMWTKSSKGPNIHLRVVFGKFKSLRTHTFHAVVQLLNPAEVNLQVLDPKKEQQYVLNKFIKICDCKWPNLLISLLTYPINIDRLYLQSNESDSVESTKLPMCLTLSDHCIGNPIIDTCSSILILLPNLIHTVFFGLNVISCYFAYSQHNTIISSNPRILGHSNVISSA